MPIPATAVSSTFPGTGAVTRVLQDKLDEVISVKDFGAVGDGVTNDTAAFQAALDYAHTIGMDVVVPTAMYLLDPIIARGGVCLRGTMPGPCEGLDGSIPHGATLLVNSGAGTSTPFITLDGYSSGCANLVIYYPNQVDPTVATTPTAYPFSIAAGLTGAGLSSGPGHVIEGITLVNAYNGIRLEAGRSSIRNCIIGALNVGILLDNIADYVIVENIIHQVMWDAWVQVPTVPSALDQWVMNNSVAIQIGRCDGYIMNSIGIFLRNTGIQLINGFSGGTVGSYGVVQNIDMDSVVYGVHAFSNNPGASTKFNNMVIGGASFSNQYCTANGIAALFAEAGAPNPPNIRWNDGGARGSWSGPNVVVNAGVVQCRHVGLVNDTGLVSPGPTLPATGVAYTVPYPTPRMVTVGGGTVTQITINGTLTNVHQGAFLLLPADTIAITYSGTPTWKWFVR